MYEFLQISFVTDIEAINLKKRKKAYVSSALLCASVPGFIKPPPVMKLAFSKNRLKKVALPISLIKSQPDTVYIVWSIFGHCAGFNCVKLGSVCRA